MRRLACAAAVIALGCGTSTSLRNDDIDRGDASSDATDAVAAIDVADTFSPWTGVDPPPGALDRCSLPPGVARTIDGAGSVPALISGRWVRCRSGLVDASEAGLEITADMKFTVLVYDSTGAMVPSPDPAKRGSITALAGGDTNVQLNFDFASGTGGRMLLGTITDVPRAIEGTEIGAIFFRFVSEREPPPPVDAGLPEYVDAAGAEASSATCADVLGPIHTYASVDEVLATVTAHDWLKCKSTTYPRMDGFRFGTDGRFRSLRFDSSGALMLGDEGGTYTVAPNGARWRFSLAGVDGTAMSFDADVHDASPSDAATTAPLTMMTDTIGLIVRLTAL